MEFQDLVVNVKDDFTNELNVSGWQLTGVSIQVDSFSDNSTVFLSQEMNAKKYDIRNMLLDLNPEQD